MLLSVHEIFRIVVMNFCGTVAPPPISYEAFWIIEFHFPQLREAAL